MLAVPGAIETGHFTLVHIVAATGLDKKTITYLFAQAGEQASGNICKIGPAYSIDVWGPVIKNRVKKSFDRCVKSTYNKSHLIEKRNHETQDRFYPGNPSRTDRLR